MWINREIEPILKERASKRPSVIITGARQTGKTTLLSKVFPQYNYVTLDIPKDAQEAEESGETFLTKHPPPIIVDEIQYAPKLLHHIKKNIDDHRDENGRFLLTGSQKFSLMHHISESLAGRCTILNCHTLSLREFAAWQNKTPGPEDLLEWIWKGGYPELHAKSLDPESFYSDYLATYLERDVLQLLHVQNLRNFDRFLRLCALRTGQILSQNSLATDIGISPNTVNSWLSVLETSGITYFLEPFFSNRSKRVVKTPKFYFLDTGLCCFLAGIRSKQDLKTSPLLGPLFETHVVGQCIRHFANQGKKEELYFFRDHFGHEVDIVIPKGNGFSLYECKWAEHPDLDAKGFKGFEKMVGEKRILSKSIINPLPGWKKTSSDILVEDSVELYSLRL